MESTRLELSNYLTYGAALDAMLAVPGWFTVTWTGVLLDVDDEADWTGTPVEQSAWDEVAIPPSDWVHATQMFSPDDRLDCNPLYASAMALAVERVEFQFDWSEKYAHIFLPKAER